MGHPLLPPQPVIYLVEPYGGSMRRQNATMPHVFWDDAVVTRGDGVFETLLVRGERAVNVDRHLARFRRSAAALDLPAPLEQQWLRATEAAIADYYREGASGDAACTWTLTRGRETTRIPTAWVTVRPADPEQERQRRDGVEVMTAPRGYTVDREHPAPWLEFEAKTLNYASAMAARRWARAQGFDDVIYIDPRTRRVLEGTTSTVIVVKKGRRLRTPAAGVDILPGTTQRAVFDYAEHNGWKCKEKDLYVDDLFSAESVWLVSSVRRGVRVTSVDRRRLAVPDNEREVAQLIEAALDL
ncbi:putative branched-chain-amino-acid aminotransferase [Corynebacterium capitovis DSM 44611]|uniref:aminodeoxychorismate lyase n=1 Tax=Corynebacterium capitovis TaxID=131081 RepID=UPI00058C8C5D|nr:aminodeoxychorismate lyase [Corynebacterium capitovis]WKD58103.1 putative branched-chain-amino-acid aminotransferase [Corynebacterium capitovis DSM 44611]